MTFDRINSIHKMSVFLLILFILSGVLSVKA
jgi:hypothetical protein